MPVASRSTQLGRTPWSVAARTSVRQLAAGNSCIAVANEATGGDSPRMSIHRYFFAGYINLAWTLRAVAEVDGGFCAIAGSHKARRGLPGPGP